MQSGGAPGTDEGASVIEYLALGALAAVILAGLIAVGGPARFGDGIRNVICVLLQHRRCPNQSRNLARRNPAMPTSCLRTQSSVATDHNVKVIAYRRNHNRTTMVQRNSDGSISETTSGQGGNGVDMYGGFGDKAKKGVPGAELSFGGNGLDISTYSTRLDFTGNPRLHLTPDQQRARYNGLVAARQRQMANEVTEDPGRSADPSFQNRRASIPVNAARELGVHTTVFKGTGGSSTDGVDSTVGMAGLDGTSTDAQIRGTSIDDNGTADKRDDVTTVKFTDTNTLKGNASVAIDPFPKGRFGSKYVKGTGKLSGEYSPVAGYEIQYRMGRPVKLTMTRQVVRSWGAGGRAGVSGGKGGGTSGDQEMTGVVSTQAVTADLVRHPEVYTSFQDYLRKKEQATQVTHPGIVSHVKSVRQMHGTQGPARAAASRLNTQLSRVGQFSQVDYDRTVRKSGPELSLSQWIQLAAAEWTTTNDDWSVKDAWFYDPAQGRWVPWTECVRGSSGTAGGH